MLPSLFVLIAGAAVGWAFFMYVLKPYAKMSFVHTPLRTTLYFLILSGVAIYTHALYAKQLFVLAPAALITLLGVFIASFFIYARAKRMSPIPEEERYRHKDLELLELSPRFLAPKLADVFFQQTIAGIALLMLYTLQVPQLLLALLFAVFFSLGHLGLLFRMPLPWTLYFLASAVVGGVLVSYLLLFVLGGIYYAIAFHLLWYVATGVFYRRMEGRSRFTS